MSEREPKDRRKHPRFDIWYTTYIRVEESSGQTHVLEATILNISLGGAMLYMDEVIAADRTIYLYLLPPGYCEGIWLEAQVVWSYPEGGSGVHFNYEEASELALVMVMTFVECTQANKKNGVSDSESRVASAPISTLSSWRDVVSHAGLGFPRFSRTIEK